MDVQVRNILSASSPWCILNEDEDVSVQEFDE
jgi:hypothetical protein